MNALVLESLGQLVLKTIELGPLPEGYARLRMLTAALNHRDEWIVQGQYAKIQYGVVLGADGCGIVVEINAADRRLLGQRVVINPNQNWGADHRVQGNSYTILGMPTHGTFAEYLDVPLDRLYPVPAHLSDEEAAAFPLAGLTAYRALFVQGQFHQSNTVLVTGIGGGVALFGLQYAKASGACAIAVTSGAQWKLERAQQLGATVGVLYTGDAWEQELRRRLGGGFDLCLDGICGEPFNRLIAAANPAARIIVYGATLGVVPKLDVHRIFWKQLHIIGSTMGSDADFEAMLRFIAEHRISPVVDAVFPLERYQDAFERMRKREQFGKIVLRIAE
ncbi:MAG: zinc-binding dehydrogenase [Chlorobi bacterium]|nr:zinc-binding dehydrogenase [Chlorobiota bacterium]